MIVTPLGHTEFLVDIENSEGRNVRILVDSWLSDYAVGDMMERMVKVRLDPEKVKTIDAIYISHAHCDHFDPYTLIEIYKHANPLLILPFTLRYLEGLIHEYLPTAEMKWLANHETFHLHGIEITGYMWPTPVITNEDDVMMLAIANDRELLFAEIDTTPDAESLDVQKSLYRVFTQKDYETVCLLASRNELEGNLKALDTTDEKSFTKSKNAYLASRREEIEWGYAKYEYDEYVDMPNIFSLPGFVRGFIGQGIGYPRSLSEKLADTNIFPLDQVADMEASMAKNYGFSFPQKALIPGRQYKVEAGAIEQGRKEYPIGQLEKSAGGASEIIRLYAPGPLFPRELSQSEFSVAKERILEVLNHRFLPYWSASPVGSLRDALIKNDGIYRVLVKFQYEQTIFEYSTSGAGFREVEYSDNMKIDEDYWLLDVLDFLDGRQEMYSSFWHRLDPKRAYRLWTCLGATFMNHDLVKKKYRLHFERAIQGKTSEGWVGDIITRFEK